MLTLDDNMSLVSMNNTRIAAMIATRELDAFINDYEMLNNHFANGFYAPIDELVMTSLKALNPTAYNSIEENFILMDYEYEDGSRVEYIAGVNIGKSPLLLKLGFFEQDLFFSFVVNAKNTENAQRALIALFE